MSETTFDEWKAKICELFDALGGEWTGYGMEMLGADEASAEEAYREGFTPQELFESELDAAS